MVGSSVAAQPGIETEWGKVPKPVMIIIWRNNWATAGLWSWQLIYRGLAHIWYYELPVSQEPDLIKWLSCQNEDDLWDFFLVN
jgi:hypothetical protein